MMPESNIKEKLSQRFVELVAAYNGFNVSYSDKDFGTDLTIDEVGRRFENRRIRVFSTGRKLDFQLKSTTVGSIEDKENFIVYDLEAKNFNDLVDRRNNSCFPLFLILFILPDEKEDWLSISDQSLLLKKCAYWYIPDRGEKSTENNSTKRIKINQRNLFNINTIHQLLKKCYDE